MSRNKANKANKNKKSEKPSAEIVHVDGSVMMVFPADVFQSGKLIYRKGEAYAIKDRSVIRWVKRGGVIVSASMKAAPTTVAEELKPEDVFVPCDHDQESEPPVEEIKTLDIDEE